MTLEEIMRRIKEEVDAELARFFAAKRKEARSIHPALVELVDQIADVTLRGGKRIRPFLCWVGYQAVIPGLTRNPSQKTGSRLKGRDDNLTHAMIGLELFQTFAIIHDDIMDEDIERRGGKTVHEFFRVRGTGYGGQEAQRFGESMAILAGDLAFVWADELMHNAKCQMINDKWNAMKEEVVYGQTLDVMRSIGVDGIEKSRADELKTAWYSVVRPLQIGSGLAISGSPSRSQSPPGRWPEDSFQVKCFEVWERFGVPVGKLFQLRDDILDGVVTEEACTKEAKDLRTQSLAALETLETSDEVRQLLVDFIQFVQNRNS